MFEIYWAKETKFKGILNNRHIEGYGICLWKNGDSYECLYKVKWFDLILIEWKI
jgi:hypothetical protein